MSAKTYTKSDLIKYTYLVVEYELAKYKHDREPDARLKRILKEDLDRAHERVVAIREALEL